MTLLSPLSDQFDRKAPGDIAVSSTSWSLIGTAISFHRVPVGAVVEVGVNAGWTQGGPSAVGSLDVASVVSAAAVNSFAADAAVPTGTTDGGAPGWDMVYGTFNVAGTLRKRVVASDLAANGSLTVQMYSKSATAASTLKAPIFTARVINTDQ